MPTTCHEYHYGRTFHGMTYLVRQVHVTHNYKCGRARPVWLITGP